MAAKRQTQTVTPGDVATLETPGDDAQPKEKKSHPTKGRRFRVMGAGEGDYCIYQITPEGSQLPNGCLIPIPEVPRFESTAEARRWAKHGSGDMLSGKQIIILQVMDIGNCAVEQRPVVTMNWKPKIQISGPETEKGS